MKIFFVAFCFTIGLCLMGADAKSIGAQFIVNLLGLGLLIWSVREMGKPSSYRKKNWTRKIYSR